MSKRHFIELANTIRQNRKDFSDKAIEVLADFCALQNAAFKRYRWLDYVNGKCGPNGGSLK